MDIREYITSEKFIWDDLLKRGAAAVDNVRKTWRKKRKIPRLLISWPAEHVRTEDNKVITHTVSFQIPDGMSSQKAAVMLAEKTKAYALLLVERRGDTLYVILESHHGVRCWKMAVKLHGDLEVLEKEEATNNAEHIGVLWRPLSASN